MALIHSPHSAAVFAACSGVIDRAGQMLATGSAAGDSQFVIAGLSGGYHGGEPGLDYHDANLFIAVCRC
jgi:hypothetical protein